MPKRTKAKKADDLKKLEGLVRRQAMRMIEVPKEERGEHYKLVRESLMESVRVLNVPGAEACELVDFLVRMIEALLFEMEAGGGAGGGRA